MYGKMLMGKYLKISYANKHISLVNWIEINAHVKRNATKCKRKKNSKKTKVNTKTIRK